MELILRPMSSRFFFKGRWNFGSESIVFVTRPVLPAPGAQANGTKVQESTRKFGKRAAVGILT